MVSPYLLREPRPLCAACAELYVNGKLLVRPCGDARCVPALRAAMRLHDDGPAVAAAPDAA